MRLRAPISPQQYSKLCTSNTFFGVKNLGTILAHQWLSTCALLWEFSKSLVGCILWGHTAEVDCEIPPWLKKAFLLLHLFHLLSSHVWSLRQDMIAHYISTVTSSQIMQTWRALWFTMLGQGANLPYRNRPKLKKVGPEVAVPGDPQQDEDIDAGTSDFRRAHCFRTSCEGRASLVLTCC